MLVDLDELPMTGLPQPLHTLATEPPDPLRIALVAPPSVEGTPDGCGGVEAVVADLADALVAAGHSVTLLGAGRSTSRARFVPLWPVPDRLGGPAPEVIHAAAARRVLVDLALTEGLDVVHDHTPAGPLNAAVLRSYGVPTVHTVHGPVEEATRRYYADLGTDVALVAVSRRQRELAPDLDWLDVVHDALRLEAWPFRAQKRNYALFLGRFHRQQAPHLALEAAHAAGLPLVLAGACSEPVEREYFEREVRPRLWPTDRLVGAPDARRTRELLLDARCLLFPVQYEEPFGLVMVQAMACGTPVVALRAGAVPEVVADGVTGLLCDRPDELLAALDRVVELDPRACRARVAGLFSAERMAESYVSAYRRARAGVGGRTGGALPGPWPDLLEEAG
ncbi:MAG TPA: glycosyltransferase [Geodermatophilus sp.]|nr:glycosyltransferase [Geodermatophilus sp.]